MSIFYPTMVHGYHTNNLKTEKNESKSTCSLLYSESKMTTTKNKTENIKSEVKKCFRPHGVHPD